MPYPKLFKQIAAFMAPSSDKFRRIFASAYRAFLFFLIFNFYSPVTDYVIQTDIHNLAVSEQGRVLEEFKTFALAVKMLRDRAWCSVFVIMNLSLEWDIL